MKRGYVLIEMVLVMLLLILVSVFVFTLAENGSRAYLRLNARQTASSDLRIGLSYIDVKIKRNDFAGAMQIENRLDRNDQALAIRRFGDSGDYLTWIYIHDGYLCEITLPENTAFKPEGGSRIAAADQLLLKRLQPDLLQVTLVLGQDRTPDRLSRTIYLHSRQAIT